MLLGFSDAREEAAFQLAKARRLELADRWTSATTAMSALMGLLATRAHVRASDAEHACTFLMCTAAWWLMKLMPAAVLAAARPLYMRHRGCVWGASIGVAGVSGGGMICALLGDSYYALSRSLIARALPLAVLEFVVHPALLRLSPAEQLLASFGSGVSVFYASRGPADGPYSAATCLALGALAVGIAAVLDASARRGWLAAQAGAAAASGPAAAGSHDHAAAASCTVAAWPDDG